jgi:branched-chain amino acid transport system permease protein
VAAFGKLRPLIGAYVALLGTTLVMLLAAGAIVEMIYHLQLNQALGPELSYLGATLNAHGLDSWFGACFVLLTAIALFELARRHFAADWGQIQEEIERDIKRREALA